MKNAVLAAVGLGVVTLFGACAVVQAGPITPITFDVGGLTSVLNPHLSQNWQLFAPDPISDERGVVARLRCGTRPSGWFDISSRSIAQTQRSRFFPNRESRIISGALVERFAEDDITKRLTSRGRRDLVTPDRSSGARAERTLARYAARVASCPSVAGAGAPAPSAVQLRYVIRPLPSWSERSRPSSGVEPRVLDSPWIEL